jgi:23S rRNA G2445 N2-methylase RlmL
MVKYIAQCVTGTENFVMLELNQLDSKIFNEEIFPGFIFFDYKGDPKNLLELKTVDDILILVKKLIEIDRYKKSLGKIRFQLENINFIKQLFFIRKIRKTLEKINYNVTASYIGRRDYKSSEIKESITRIINRHTDWKYNKEEYELHFKTFLSNEISFLGLSIDDVPLFIKRKIKTVPGSIKSGLANIMINICELQKKDTILDPACGSGMIAIESLNITNKVYANDHDKEILEIAKNNAISKNKNIEFSNYDIKKSKFENDTFDKIICNLPFGKQVEKQPDFIKDFIHELKRISKNKSKWVLLTKDTDEIKKYIDIQKEIEIINSGLKSKLIIINNK